MLKYVVEKEMLICPPEKMNVCEMEENMLIKKIDGNVAILKLNRPKQANALNRDLFINLKEESDALQRNDEVRVVVITE